MALMDGPHRLRHDAILKQTGEAMRGDMQATVQPFEPAMADEVNALVRQAYAGLQGAMPQWELFSSGLGQLVAQAAHSEVLVVRETGPGPGHIVAAVGYVPPGAPKREFFAPEWPIVRLLAVSPAQRGQGLGRLLVLACIERAQRDGAPLLALHSSPVMAPALRLYAAMGFERLRELPDMFGVPYALYAKHLTAA
jgi:GNAT superfamily N-acetyltransferase